MQRLHPCNRDALPCEQLLSLLLLSIDGRAFRAYRLCRHSQSALRSCTDAATPLIQLQRVGQVIENGIEILLFFGQHEAQNDVLENTHLAVSVLVKESSRKDFF